MLGQILSNFDDFFFSNFKFSKGCSSSKKLTSTCERRRRSFPSLQSRTKEYKNESFVEVLLGCQQRLILAKNSVLSSLREFGCLASGRGGSPFLILTNQSHFLFSVMNVGNEGSFHARREE